MQQALAHEAACQCLLGSDMLEAEGEQKEIRLNDKQG